VPSKPKAAGAATQFYNIWSSEESSNAPQAPPPRKPLPTSSESYNPPPEYLPTDEERKNWEDADPEDREQDYLPKSHSALRHVPAYDRFIQERFSRQLDLYLAPRVQRKRLNINADDLIPKLPHPDTLRPFPVYCSLTLPASGRVRCVATSPDGAWAISGDEKGFVSLWEVNVGKSVKQWTFTSKITALEWCPRKDVNFFVVATSVLRSCLFTTTNDHTVKKRCTLWCPLTRRVLY
jgi:ribosome biogenesis protein ERB1